MQAIQRSAPLATSVLVLASLALGGARADLVNGKLPMPVVPKATDRIQPADSLPAAVVVRNDETAQTSVAVRRDGSSRVLGF